jgi:hypothetical protein
MVPIGTVPSPSLDDVLRIMAIIDLLSEIDRGSVVKAGLGWNFALRPCVAPVARLASGLLYLLLDVATHGLLVLVALAIVIPPVPEASFRGTTDLRSITVVLRPQEHVPSGRYWKLPVELHERVLG